MNFTVNGKTVKEDGDWFSCPECDDYDYPLLSWMSYCPCCGEELHFREKHDVVGGKQE